MADTGTQPETNQEPLAPEVTPSAPAKDNTQLSADADALKKAQQLEMERNLLRKKIDALEKEKSERERKELEEREDYRSLAERAIAEAEALRKEKEDAEKSQAVKLATETVYSGFDAKVVEIAKTAGISATDDSEEAQAALRSKLEAIQEKVGITKQPTPTPNNPSVQTPEGFDKVKTYERMKWDNPTIRNAAVKTAVGNLESIKAMKQISGMTPQEI